ncbi:dehydration-responsive element-binding protein 1H-like [Triticum dicoccoides]|uniref:dehydration-responsive element-binding protein 1H-like n=1 Tax=Triticum dicoccoides TaxID=85692 RepID=UPI001890BBA7|nr:dehydration-responsive element-binding protein 1H-like [Triticum dicoccoides]
MDMSLEHSSSPSSSSTTERAGTAWPWPPKRPAGRTKFRETRHPVFRGVRRRGSAGRWVCEVRVPGERGTRLWLGTYITAEAAARAHDAAMLMLRGHSAACLNFRDSAWLLAVPPAFTNLSDVRRAAVQAVADFLRRPEATSAAAAVQEVTSSVSAPSSAVCSVPSSETAQASPDAAFEAPAALDMDVFDLDCLFGETDSDAYYYANLAQGLLMEPPPTVATGSYWDNGDCADGGAGADVALWSY